MLTVFIHIYKCCNNTKKCSLKNINAKVINQINDNYNIEKRMNGDGNTTHQIENICLKQKILLDMFDRKVYILSFTNIFLCIIYRFPPLTDNVLAQNLSESRINRENTLQPWYDVVSYHIRPDRAKCHCRDCRQPKIIPFDAVIIAPIFYQTNLLLILLKYKHCVT